ncbi:MAG: DUF4402 domain-containing protein [Phenylobacterium sp.]
MKRAFILVAAATVAFACTAQSLAAVGAKATVRATITGRTGIDVVNPTLILPSVIANPVVSNATFAGSVPSVSPSVSGANIPGAQGSNILSTPAVGNAALTIYGQSGDTVSTAVPASFQVVRTGGTEALTVNTTSNASVGLSQNGVVLGGTSMSGDTLSVNIGGAISLASAGELVPGPYEGLLVVVVQYN